MFYKCGGRERESNEGRTRYWSTFIHSKTLKNNAYIISISRLIRGIWLSLLIKKIFKRNFKGFWFMCTFTHLPPSYNQPVIRVYMVWYDAIWGIFIHCTIRCDFNKFIKEREWEHKTLNHNDSGLVMDWPLGRRCEAKTLRFDMRERMTPWKRLDCLLWNITLFWVSSSHV